MMEEFKALPAEEQTKLVRLMLNERVPVYHQDQSFSL